MNRKAVLGVRSLALALLALHGSENAGSFEIPAWAFDRGNVRTFTEQWADAGPMVAFGGQSPVVAEYDIPFPAPGVYRLSVCYAASAARPVDLAVDGQPGSSVCRTANGSWQTSGAEWESSATLEVAGGVHTLRLARPGDFPHVVGLRFESAVIPDQFVPNRPKAPRLAQAGAAANSATPERQKMEAVLRRRH